MATRKKTTKKKEYVYRPKKAFRRKNPDGQWVLFKPWNTYKPDTVAFIDGRTKLFDKETA